ncbi:MAG: MotA/TolQ/ExbB proton channel family protein, partial [Dongiaceae bacterium]
LWIAGLASKPFAGDTAALCWIILGIGALGIACVFTQRWRDVQWIATHVVRIGLLGTVVGLIIAFSAARNGASAEAEQVKTMIAAVVSGMYVSLYATLLGIAVNLWLKVNLRLLGDVHG